MGREKLSRNQILGVAYDCLVVGAVGGMLAMGNWIIAAVVFVVGAVLLPIIRSLVLTQRRRRE